MYLCLECSNLFEECQQYSETHGLDSPPYETWSGCPACGSGAVVETQRCSYCGDWIVEDYVELPAGELICDNCYVVRNVEDGW